MFQYHELFLTIWHLPRNFLIALIGVYQQTLSPDHGLLRHMHPYGFCRHQPTCSEYGKQVLRERGFVLGILLAAKRILSCNPWTKPDEARIRRVLKGT